MVHIFGIEHNITKSCSNEGWKGLVDEIEMEVTRISARNLGRDDRIITDHGKEARFPFLDEQVVQFISGLPIHFKVRQQKYQ